jgi:hypothetical protein
VDSGTDRCTATPATACTPDTSRWTTILAGTNDVMKRLKTLKSDVLAGK